MFGEVKRDRKADQRFRPLWESPLEPRQLLSTTAALPLTTATATTPSAAATTTQADAMAESANVLGLAPESYRSAMSYLSSMTASPDVQNGQLPDTAAATTQTAQTANANANAGIARTSALLAANARTAPARTRTISAPLPATNVRIQPANSTVVGSGQVTDAAYLPRRVDPKFVDLSRDISFAKLRPLPADRARAPIETQLRRSGRLIEVTDSDREHFLVGLVGPGTVRVLPDTNGRAAIIVDGSTTDTELVIEPRVKPFTRQDQIAHQFALGQTRQDKQLHVSDISVSSGQIGAISGYRTTILSGKVDIGSSTTPVSRIAVYEMLPGASIRTGQDLNTLEVYRGITLDGVDNVINIGRDLNLFNVGADVTLKNGANIKIGRAIGMAPQSAKGSGASSIVPQNSTRSFTVSDQVSTLQVGGDIKGNFALDGTSSFIINRGTDQENAPLLIRGDLTGYPSITVYRTNEPANQRIQVLTQNGALLLSQVEQTTQAILGPNLSFTEAARRADFIVQGNTPDTPPLPVPPGQ